MKIRDIVTKPSEALQAMVDGLKEQDEREDFEIDMDVWGMVRNKMCFGCAATCAIQKIAGKNLNHDIPKEYMDKSTGEIRAVHLHEEILGLETTQEATDFECAINNARKGKLPLLFKFFDIYPVDYMTYAKYKTLTCIYDDKNNLMSMETNNWRKFIPFVEKKIMQLQEAGY